MEDLLTQVNSRIDLEIIASTGGYSKEPTEEFDFDFL
jgi:hypothetical protein